MPEGAQALIPAPWLAQRLNLKPHSTDEVVYVDNSGEILFVFGRSPSDGSHAFIDQQLFQTLLREDGLACVWIFVTERSAWPGGDNENASRRRSEGVERAQQTPDVSLERRLGQGRLRAVRTRKALVNQLTSVARIALSICVGVSQLDGDSRRIRFGLVPFGVRLS